MGGSTTSLKAKLVSVTTALALVATQSTFLGVAVAAEPEADASITYAQPAAQSQFAFAKTDGSVVSLDESNTLHVNLLDNGVLTTTYTTNAHYSTTPEGGLLSAGLNPAEAVFTKTGTFQVSCEDWDQFNDTQKFNLEVAPSGVTQVRAYLDGQLVENGGSVYYGTPHDGARQVVTLEALVNGEWVAVPQASFTLTQTNGNSANVCGPTTDSISERNSITIDKIIKNPAQLTATLNEEGGASISFSVIPGEKPDMAEKSALEQSLASAQSYIEASADVTDPAVLKELKSAVSVGKGLMSNESASQQDVNAAVDRINAALEDAQSTPVVYVELADGSKVIADGDTVTLTSLQVGTFKVAHADVLSWDCVEEVAEINPENGKTVRYLNYWLNAAGDYQPHGVKVMDASVTMMVNGEKVTKQFKIDTRPAGVTEIKAFVGGEAADKVNIQGRDWTKVTVEGFVNDEWIMLPKQAFVIVPQHNIHTYEDSFRLWEADKDFTIEVKLVENNDVTTSFTARSGFVALDSFSVTVPKTEWVLDKWDTATNSFVGLRWYDQGDDRGYNLAVTPSNATNWDLNWASSNPEVAYFEPLHSGGIVAQTAGDVSFDITSVSNPMATPSHLDLTFVYKTPLVLATAEDMVLTKGQSAQAFNVQCAPADATDQRFVWSTSNDAVTVDQLVGVAEDTTTTYQYAVEAAPDFSGVVSVTGVPVDQTNGAEPVQFTVTVNDDVTFQGSGNGWWVTTADGTYIENDFATVDGQTFYFGDNGWMAYGWTKIDGVWYYFNPVHDGSFGAMTTGWAYTDSAWSYFDANGIMQTGWFTVGDTYYYASGSGYMQTGWQYLDGHWFYLASSGAMAVGWNYINGAWYYMNEKHDGTYGAMMTGWQVIGGKDYYFYGDGSMAANTWSGWYYLGSDGAMVKNTTTPDGYTVDENGRWVQ